MTDLSHHIPDVPTGPTEEDVSHQTETSTTINTETYDDSLYNSVVSHENEGSMSISSHGAVDHNDCTPSLTGFHEYSRGDQQRQTHC